MKGRPVFGRCRSHQGKGRSKRVERRESGAPGDFEWIENTSAEELERFIEGEPDIHGGQTLICRDDAQLPEITANHLE